MWSAWAGNILGFYLKQDKCNLRYRIILSDSMIAVIPSDDGLMRSNLFMLSKISLYFWVLFSSTEGGKEHLFDLGFVGKIDFKFFFWNPLKLM